MVKASPESDVPGGFVELNWHTYYEKCGSGSGETVILVHGFSTPCYVWDPTFEALSAAGFNVLRYDLYGRGYSERPKLKYDLGLFVEQLEQLVIKLDIKSPFHLAGVSFGGWVCAEYANHYPVNIKSLILIDPLVSNKPLLQRDIFYTPLIGDLYFSLYYGPFILPASQSNDFFNCEPFPDWEEKYRAQMKIRGFKRAILSTIRSIRKVDGEAIYQRLSELGIPSLLFWGKEDRVIGLEEIQTLRSILPGIKYQEITNAGHVPHLEKPEIINQLILDFISSLSS